jgi:hypothetical protein
MRQQAESRALRRTVRVWLVTFIPSALAIGFLVFLFLRK